MAGRVTRRPCKVVECLSDFFFLFVICLFLKQTLLGSAVPGGNSGPPEVFEVVIYDPVN